MIFSVSSWLLTPPPVLVSLAAPWTRRRNLIKWLVPRLQLRYSPDCLWLTCNNYSSRIQSLVQCSQPGKPSPPTSRNSPCRHWCSSTLDCSWKMGSSVIGRLTSIRVLSSSWFCLAHFGLMFWCRFKIYGPPRLWAHHGAAEALCLLAHHVQRGQGLHQQLWAVHYGPCTRAPHHFQSSACQPSPWNPDNQLHKARDC